MIGIVDYGMGNLFSVRKALERLGSEYIISDKPEVLGKTDALILPGVGSFKDAMDLLNQAGLTAFLREYTAGGGYLLGICLGMQLLFEESEENGDSDGLGLLPGRIVRFPGVTDEGQSYKVPHMGWNKLAFRQDAEILSGCGEDYVYFVHSYYLEGEPDGICIATADYHKTVPAIAGRKNVLGMQFHPEKSGELGMKLLKNYLDLAEKKVKS